MLTNIPKVGDRVLIIETRSHRPNPQTAVIDKVTKKFIYCCGKKFDLEGRHVDSFPCFALLDGDFSSYQEEEKRDRLISKIKIIANTHRFGEALSTESLEAIAQLMEVQNAKYL